MHHRCLVRAASILAVTLAAAQLSAQPQRAGAGLRIVVIEGEDAVNIVQQKTAVAPIVEVRDRNNQPVAGAVVRFAIRGGRATFGGSKTLAVTTDLGGRAAAAGLLPTGSGALQISAAATFEGQSAAAITIAQTNVMTAAQAAQIGAAASGSSGSGSAATTGGAASGGGGGVSATTIGVIGAAGAAGAVAAVKLSGGLSGGPTHYLGRFSGPEIEGPPGDFCERTLMFSGSVEMNLDASENGAVTGDASVSGDTTITAINPRCAVPLPVNDKFSSGGAPISGSAGNVAFSKEVPSPYSANQFSAAGVQTDFYEFTGVLNGGTITGTLFHRRVNVNQAGFHGEGSTTFAVTLQ